MLSIGHVAMAAETEVIGGVYSADSYDGFTLSWQNNGERDLLMSATDEKGTIAFQYDDNGYRTSKTNTEGEATVFAYDDNCNLISVQYGNHFLEYSYNAKGELIEVIIDGINYTCVLDAGSVYQLIDTAGNVAVQYSYENNFVSAVYGSTEQGKLVDRTTDETFVGNLNKVTYNSYYFDEETSWYYCGRYVDSMNGRFVDGVDITVEEVLRRIDNSRLVNALYRKGYQAAAQLVQSANFGCAIDDDSSNWYVNLSDVELLARVIYGENPYNDTPADERKAVAWVLWNRKIKPGYGGNTLREVVTNPGHFEPLDAGCSSYKARNPETATNEWMEAVSYACLIYYAEVDGHTTADLVEAMPRPYGITENHLFFSNYDSSLEKLNNGKTLVSAVIAGYGSVGDTALDLELAYDDYVWDLYEETGVELETGTNYVGKVNIFYTNYPG
ncbi:MAG: cell wall hydrolase [Lachnospiraceae bacterium]|nr:cell wall hydrolase [Lachnospiraceae bacterium]